MLTKNAEDSIKKKPVKLVELAFHPDDLTLIVTELSCSARYLEVEIDSNDGTMNQAWIDRTWLRIHRLNDIARAIVLASR